MRLGEVRLAQALVVEHRVVLEPVLLSHPLRELQDESPLGRLPDDEKRAAVQDRPARGAQQLEVAGRRRDGGEHGGDATTGLDDLVAQRRLQARVALFADAVLLLERHLALEGEHLGDVLGGGAHGVRHVAGGGVVAGDEPHELPRLLARGGGERGGRAAVARARRERDRERRLRAHVAQILRVAPGHPAQLALPEQDRPRERGHLQHRGRLRVDVRDEAAPQRQELLPRRLGDVRGGEVQPEERLEPLLDALRHNLAVLVLLKDVAHDPVVACEGADLLAHGLGEAVGGAGLGDVEEALDRLLGEEVAGEGAREAGDALVREAHGLEVEDDAAKKRRGREGGGVGASVRAGWGGTEKWVCTEGR